MAQQITNLEQLFQVIFQRLGLETGKKIRAEIDNLLAIEQVDVKKIQDLLKTIQQILDANPDTPEFDVAQNIITQITNLKKQIQANSDAIKELQGKVKELEDAQAQTQQASQSDVNDLKQEVENLKATKADKDYVENNFVSKDEVLTLNIDKLIGGFVKCLDKGFKNPNADSCGNESNTHSQNNQSTSTDVTDASSSADSDGGVL